MAVIGIDPGTALTGFGIVERLKDGSLRALDYGVIQTSKDDDPAVRLWVLYDSLKEKLARFNLSSSAVEKLYFQRNTTTAISVGQARGVVLLAMAKNGLPVFEYNPSEIKQAVTGYGMAEKRQIQEMVKLLLNLDEIPRPDDAADALAVAICHINSMKFSILEAES